MDNQNTAQVPQEWNAVVHRLYVRVHHNEQGHTQHHHVLQCEQQQFLAPQRLTVVV